MIYLLIHTDPKIVFFLGESPGTDYLEYPLLMDVSDIRDDIQNGVNANVTITLDNKRCELTHIFRVPPFLKQADLVWNDGPFNGAIAKIRLEDSTCELSMES